MLYIDGHFWVTQNDPERLKYLIALGIHLTELSMITKNTFDQRYQEYFTVNYPNSSNRFVILPN